MNKVRWLVVLAVATLPVVQARANTWPKNTPELMEMNQKLKGVVVDFTANHGQDNRMYSRTLGQRRDLYVYLPPGYDSSHRYPVMLWMHGVGQDEQCFLRCVVRYLDDAIVAGELPPIIVAAPDGSIRGEPTAIEGSFFLNTDVGDFEDFLLFDVWDHVCHRYAIRPEREAHILAGWSMGGFAAYHLGIKHRNHFGIVAGISPPLNVRWMGANGRYAQDFDPYHWYWRESAKAQDVVAVFPLAAQVVRLGDLFEKLFPDSPNPVWELSAINPIEMVERLALREGDLKMFVAYGGNDEFNIDAQVESFLYLCKWRRLTIWVDYDEKGCHNSFCLKQFVPSMLTWLGRQLAPICQEEWQVGGQMAHVPMMAMPPLPGHGPLQPIPAAPAEPVVAPTPPVTRGGFLRQTPLRHFLPCPKPSNPDPVVTPPPAAGLLGARTGLPQANSTSPDAVYPNGACPNGACPNGACPNGAYPNGAHPTSDNANYPSGFLPPVSPAVRPRPQ